MLGRPGAVRLANVSEISTQDVQHDDQQLVDVVSAVLVDPNVHTDLRMRLQEEIRSLLHSAHEHSHAAAEHPRHLRESPPAPEHLPELMQAVLSDPNLHTDMRMRLHREIPEIVRAAQEASAAGSS